MPARATQVVGSMPPRSTDNENDWCSVGVHLPPQGYAGRHTAPVMKRLKLFYLLVLRKS